MNYAIEMRLGAMMYVRSFIKIGPGIQNLMGGGGEWSYSYKQEDDLIGLLLFCRNMESRLKTTRNVLFKQE
jgi:hypothetical protein